MNLTLFTYFQNNISYYYVFITNLLIFLSILTFFPGFLANPRSLQCSCLFVKSSCFNGNKNFKMTLTVFIFKRKAQEKSHNLAFVTAVKSGANFKFKFHSIWSSETFCFTLAIYCLIKIMKFILNEMKRAQRTFE